MNFDALQRTLVAIPTYDERANIKTLIVGILSLPIELDILVVDDNSPDGTAKAVAELAKIDHHISLVVRTTQRGLGSAHRLCWAEARRRGYQNIITLDADLSHDIFEIPLLLAELGSGADFVIGSRFMTGGTLDYSGIRYLTSWSANMLARSLLGLPIHEYTTSFRAARLDRIKPGLIESIEADGYSFFLSSVVAAVRSGARISEVPIHFRKRAGGVSKLNKSELIKGIVNLIRLTFDRQKYRSIPRDRVAPEQASE